MLPRRIAGAIPAQEALNRAVYNAPGVYRRYTWKTLEPHEIACLLKYQPKIAGHKVLDVGVGAGRTARYLAPLAAEYHAIDYSPVMVRYMHQHMPQVRTHLADFRDLHLFPDASFDFVLATNNVIDVLSHDGRMAALREAARVLEPGGVLAFSSHNLRYSRAFKGPRIRWSSNPVGLAAAIAKYVLGIWNHMRVRRFREVFADYALLNDSGHHYACLHYYAARTTVASQINDAGLRIRDVFSRNGELLPATADDMGSAHLLYVAERP